ncbi:MAG: carbohydrate-binding module family 14 protein [Pseudomonadota bacterium]
MKLKIAVFSAVMLAPTMSLAMGCSHGKEQQVMSCAAGTAYDSATNSCLPVTT